MPAIQAHFERWPDDARLSVEELREIVTLVTCYAEVRAALMRYVEVLGGVSEN